MQERLITLADVCHMSMSLSCHDRYNWCTSVMLVDHSPWAMVVVPPWGKDHWFYLFYYHINCTCLLDKKGLMVMSQAFPSIFVFQNNFLELPNSKMLLPCCEASVFLAINSLFHTSAEALV